MTDGTGTEAPSDVESDASAMVRPSWGGDLLRIAAIVVATYAAFFVVGLLTGVNINEILSTLETITFYGAVFALGALALNLHWGYTGMFNIGVVGFMAIGVYTLSIATASPEGTPAGFGLPIPVGIVLGFITASLAGFIVALPALRVRADYFAIVTLGFSEIVRLSAQSGALRRIGESSYGTGGGQGIRAPPTDNIVGWMRDMPGLSSIVDGFIDAGIAVGVPRSIMTNYAYDVVLAIFVIAFFLLLTRIAYSPFGRLLKAIREDDLAAQSLGKSTNRTKIVVFVLGCGLMGLAGMLWQGSNTHISPNHFRPVMTFYIFVALIMGGSGSNTGSVIGGFAFAAFIYEGPRFVKTIVDSNLDLRSPPTINVAFGDLANGDVMPLLAYLSDSMQEIRYIILGVVLIVLMIKWPDGLLGHRKEIAAAVDLRRQSPATDGGAVGAPAGGTDEPDATEEVTDDE